MKLFLLDAYALIYRAYYALIKMPRISSTGFDTSAVFGFVNTLEEVLSKEKPTHIGIAFDPIGLTFRHQLFDKYKAQRKETPDVIRRSLPIIKEIIRSYRIPILEVSGYEADDVIGTIARKVPRDWTVFMMTPDKDYGQLVDQNIFMYKPKHGGERFEILGVDEVTKKYSLSNPLQMIDFLGLMGDQSDNIPGCPGVGEVTAKKLIAEFGSIENLLDNTHRLKKSLKIKIEENKEIILFSKFLATIQTDVPISFHFDELVRKEIDKPALRKIFEELEFRQLISRIFGETKTKKGDMFSYNQSSLFSKFTNDYSSSDNFQILKFDHLKTVPHRYSVLKNPSEIYDLIFKIKAQSFFSFDTETTGINPIFAELIGLSFALQEGEAYFLPVSGTKEEIERTIQPFKEILESRVIVKIGQNIKYDVNVLKKYGIRVTLPIFDTLIAHYLIKPEYRHNLDYLAETYLNYKTIHIEELIGKRGKNQLTMKQVSLENLMDYACEDADVALRLKNIFESMIAKENFSDLFYQIELPLVLVLAEMEEVGVELDVIALKESSVILNQSLKELEKIIFQISGKIFNINSSKMVGEILFDRLKIVENSKKTKSGQYTTSENLLEKIRNKHPIVPKILAYRKLKKLLTTYIDALPHLIFSSDKKIHTTYNQFVTSTGRLSSTNPNLQNIPIRDEEGKEIRRAFVPGERNYFLSVDYSQIELRIMAHLSEDEKMIEAFQSGIDIHSATATKIFNIPFSEVTSEKRRKAKIANFGIIYGISVFGLAERLQISRLEAKELIDDYFTVFSSVKTYMDKSIAIACEKEYVETIFHRKRFLPDIRSGNAIVRGYAERNAINTPIQGSAADIMKLAMNRIYKRFREENLRSKMIIQVHDELDFTVFVEELEKVKQIVVYEMEHAVSLKVPLVVTCGVGKNWLEAH